jgi:inner membrane protein
MQSTFRIDKPDSLTLAGSIYSRVLLFSFASLVATLFFHYNEDLVQIVAVSIIALPVGGVPGLIFLWLVLVLTRWFSNKRLMFTLFLVSAALGTLVYAVPFAFLVSGLLMPGNDDFLQGYFYGLGWFISIMAVSMLLIRKKIELFFFDSSFSYKPDNNIIMETGNSAEVAHSSPGQSHSNTVLIKGIITGVLILCMLIPVLYITNLVSEREQRHKQIEEEVSSKWSSRQTLSGPFLFIPYTTQTRLANGTTQETDRHYWLTPDQLQVNGIVDHEIRKRSIYKVLLYRAALTDTGRFRMQLPADVDAASIRWKDARICFGISDLKGIEERMTVNLNGKELELAPGIPADDLVRTGLSAPLDLTDIAANSEIPFTMKFRIRGSRQLHFLPLSGTGKYSLQSAWPHPSFDGNSLPGDPVISSEGFMADWSFNKANLPFGTVISDMKKDDLASLAFGVTMLQAADHYAKTSRSVKYAILFVGLTFALFFIIELMQKKPFHPVQYVLTGLALVIFYSLLLSISEFVNFDIAYVIAAAAVVILITLYARSHFQSWKSAGLFFSVLTTLYAFIFVLIRLEDTALLVGSVGLFIVLALVMYASRKIKWYGNEAYAI